MAKFTTRIGIAEEQEFELTHDPVGTDIPMLSERFIKLDVGLHYFSLGGAQAVANVYVK